MKLVQRTNQKVGRIKQYFQWIILGIFEYARFLDVINCRLDRQRMKVLPAKKFYIMVSIIVRLIIEIAFWDVIPAVYVGFFKNPKNFMQLFTVQQLISIAVSSAALFAIKLWDERRLLGMINRVMRLSKTVAELTNTNYLFSRKFLLLICLKGCITLLGYINELPTLLNIETLNISKWFGIVIGVYLWLGCMFVLDVCYLGFLIMSLIYGNLGTHLEITLHKMQTLEARNHEGCSLTTFNRMKLVCEYSEKLDDLGVIYSRLYKIAKDFVYIFQWRILYYIYYNFMVIFLLLSHCIWQYIRNSYVDTIEIFMVMVKIGNLALLIMCANYAVEKSEMPNQLSLDVVCSDIDIRWDNSVETFLNRRKVENLEIKVLGFFTLDNQFILLILSAIISYLFLIIQFGMNGGFGTRSES